MQEISIRRARSEDAEEFNAALSKLSDYLGDRHMTRAEDLQTHCFSQPQAFAGLIAEREDEAVGAALLSPIFSTTRGGAGVFVSDLWVSEGLRGAGLGRRLLAHAIRLGEELWGARFLKLNVHHSNSGAMSAYERLGFDALHEETMMSLERSAFEKLRKVQ